MTRARREQIPPSVIYPRECLAQVIIAMSK